MVEKILFVAPDTYETDYTMWFTYSPASGNTTPIAHVRRNVLKTWAIGGDYDSTHKYDITQLEKTEEFKKARVVKKRDSVVRTIVAPIYKNVYGEDYPRGNEAHGYPKMARYDIYGLDLENTIKPTGKMYIVHIQDRKYTHVHFFLTRKEATNWVKSMSEDKKPKSRLAEKRQQGHMQSRLFLGQFINEEDAEVLLYEFVDDSPFKCVMHINAHRMNFMTNKKVVYAEVVIERGILNVNTEDSTYSMPSRIIDKIFVDEYTLKIVCKDLSLEIIKVK